MEPLAFSIPEFCARHNISRSYLYELWKRNLGPKAMQLGGRRLISVEAAADWRHRMETGKGGEGATKQ